MTNASDVESSEIPAPCDLVLELWRAKEAGRSTPALEFFEEAQDYVRRMEGGSVANGRFGWGPEVFANLAAIQSERMDRPAAEWLGVELGDLLDRLQWHADQRRIGEALDEKRPVHLTLRFAATELHALPWEFVKVGPKALGAIPDLLIRYEWPGTTTATSVPNPPEGGRIVFAYSGAADRVPEVQHLSAIRRACQDGHLLFEEDRDVVPRLSLRRLQNALQKAPVAVLHILCHGGPTGSRIPSYGLVWNNEEEEGGREVVDAATLRELLADHVRTLRLVVLCACYSGNAGELHNRLGSVAQELHRAGIPAVLASRYPMSTEASSELTETLYQKLLVEARSLEEAVIAVRRRLHEEHRTRVDWASLQLYARAGDGPDHRPFVLRPYRGLLAFQEEHARCFFGRDDEVKETVGDLLALIEAKRPRFLIVTGGSGTGKSSLVFAGVVPALRARDPRWVVAAMRPTASLQASIDEARASRKDPGAPLLLLVDQFEEIFTGAMDRTTREALVRQLWSLAGDPASGISVIVTLRVDFLARCAEISVDDGLTLEDVAFDEAHRVFVRKMKLDRIREIIERPAQKAGLVLEKGLVEQMLKDAGDEPGVLPLLQYALDQMWQIREGRRITLDIYRRIGGIAGALEGQADDLVKGLTDAQKTAARRLLVQLVATHDDETLDTRRRASLVEIRPSGEAEAAVFDDVLARLVGQRLLVQTSDDVDKVPVVEVAHEQLIRSWGTLRGWLREDRTALQLRQLFRGDARRWAVEGRRPERLWRGRPLKQVIELVTAGRSEPSRMEADFLRAALTQRIVLEFRRANNAEDPYAFTFATQDYFLRHDSGEVTRASFQWDQQGLLSDLTSMRGRSSSGEASARLSEALRSFLRALGWSTYEGEVERALDEGRPVQITLRSGAAELFALPWELVPLSDGRRLGTLPGCLIHYEWPGTRTLEPSSELSAPGRILLAWSAAGGAVPAAELLKGLQTVCQQAQHPFDAHTDAIGHASLRAIREALESAKRTGRPVQALHIVYQTSAEPEQSTPTNMVLSSSQEDSKSDLIDPDRLRDAIAPYAEDLRLVILCSCRTEAYTVVLHKIGIPAVIGFRHLLRFADSIEFTSALYHQLLTMSSSLQDAFLTARGRLSESSYSAAWASPQLYVRAADGPDLRPISLQRGLHADARIPERPWYGGLPKGPTPREEASTDAPQTDVTRRIVLELWRVRDMDNPHSFALEPQDYVLRHDDCRIHKASLPWNDQLLSHLDSMKLVSPTAEGTTRLGEILRSFLHDLGFGVYEREIEQAITEGRPVVITFRCGAAELFALPWELVPLSDGRRLGTLPGCVIQYEWPGTRTLKPSGEVSSAPGRILFAWSAAGGAVPARAHMERIQAACSKAQHPFEETADVVAHASLKALTETLKSAYRSDRRVQALHVLCHAATGHLTFRSSGGESESEQIDPQRFRDALAPYADSLRLVVLCSSPTHAHAVELHKLGIPAVIGFRYPLQVDHSTAFVNALYHHLLAAPSCVQSAFLAARGCLSETFDSAAWASPQLYVRAGGADVRPIALWRRRPSDSGR